MCVENGIIENDYLNAEVMCKKFEDAIQRAVEEIVDKEMYFYCTSCMMYFSKYELEQEKYCRFCGAEAIDLRDYIA
jgi:Zn finger protein HypA/HybF involved in hydrogenase expression